MRKLYVLTDEDLKAHRPPKKKNRLLKALMLALIIETIVLTFVLTNH